jgi:hypothetical protein
MTSDVEPATLQCLNKLRYCVVPLNSYVQDEIQTTF